MAPKPIAGGGNPPSAPGQLARSRSQSGVSGISRILAPRSRTSALRTVETILQGIDTNNDGMLCAKGLPDAEKPSSTPSPTTGRTASAKASAPDPRRIAARSEAHIMSADGRVTIILLTADGPPALGRGWRGTWANRG